MAEIEPKHCVAHPSLSCSGLKQSLFIPVPGINLQEQMTSCLPLPLSETHILKSIFALKNPQGFPYWVSFLSPEHCALIEGFGTSELGEGIRVSISNQPESWVRFGHLLVEKD